MFFNTFEQPTFVVCQWICTARTPYQHRTHSMPNLQQVSNAIGGQARSLWYGQRLVTMLLSFNGQPWPKTPVLIARPLRPFNSVTQRVVFLLWILPL